VEVIKHETCPQYVARRLSEGWKIINQSGFKVILQSPEGIIRPVDLRNDIETLRPNAAGDETSISGQLPSSTYHWDKVDDATPDGDTTCVQEYRATYYRDLYNLPAHSVGSGTINSITIYFCIASADSAKHAYAKPSQKSGTTVTDGTQQTQAGTTYSTKSQTYTTNPATGVAYTWDEIDALQIGVCLHGDSNYYSRCTQVYVEVNYTPAFKGSRGFIIG
jgi:hypothetical protein